MSHYPVKVEDQETDELWRCAVCGHEEVLPALLEDKPTMFDTLTECVGYNPSPG